MYSINTSTIIFIITLIATFLAALLARMHSLPTGSEEDLAGRNLNKWMVGISAGTTGNSGFIVTAAVGLGFSGGVHWLLLPLSWLLGDLLFWHFFPERLNLLARKGQSTTLSELLTFDLSGRAAKFISITVALLLIIFLSTYTSAQWLAGKKFLSAAFNLDALTSLLFFATTIVAYSSLGGFRGSIYTDVVQAVIRVVGTMIALIAVMYYALEDTTLFNKNIGLAGDGFLSLFPNPTFLSVLGFILGYAGAAIGFGLGQPQIVSRYLAGSSPDETKAAKWIYIGFVQLTWIAMTLFGILLRGIMPNIEDPETGLSVFFQSHLGSIATGIILADVYATIASTSNGILVAITQTVKRDLILPITGYSINNKAATTILTLFIGIITIILSFVLSGNVFTIAVDAISKIGAGLAGSVMIKVFNWEHTSKSLLCAIITGICASFLWKYLGYSATLNEAIVGIVSSLLVNFLFSSKNPIRVVYK
jgi:Na+/proline symporter